MTKKKSFLKRKSTWIILSILVIVAFIVVTAMRGQNVEYEVEAATRGQIKETVNVTGQIKPESSATLRFKISGIVDSLRADVGDGVRRGQLLATLDDSNLQKELTRREAELNAADVALRNARQDREDTLIKNNQALAQVYADAPSDFSDILNLSNKVYNAMDVFYDDDRGDITQPIRNSVGDSSLVAAANQNRFFTNRAIADIRATLQNFPTTVTEEKIRDTLDAIQQPLRDLQTGLTSVIAVVNDIEAGFEVTATDLDTYKTNLATAESNLNSAISKELSLLLALNNALTDSDLNVSSSDSLIRLREADVKTAKAAVEIAKQNISDAFLYAPISGTVAVRSKELGELVTASDEVFFIIGDGELEITSNIPEVDIGLVQIGDYVDTTLDALGSDQHFSAKVEAIDPDQTTIDGVVYYKTTIKFDAIDPRFKSGMSVNLDITVDEKEDALIIPRRATRQESGETIVRVFKGEEQKPEDRVVQIGLRSETEVEVVSGLTEGEVIVVGEK